MPTTDDVLALTCELIRLESITPADAGCQDMLAGHLSAAGFDVRSMPFGAVSNLWARHGDGAPLVVFAGHTDVVPTGPLADWRSAPFEPTLDAGLLYGRGAADMKSSLAAMTLAATEYVQKHPNHAGSIAFLITSDEEGDAVDGTVKVVEQLAAEGVKIDLCVVGEPSSSDAFGDVLRVGRRGSLNGRLRVDGVQGHVAYPDDAINPIHLALGGLDRLAQTVWDSGDEYFPPTSFQISNINAGTGATNVVPGTLTAAFNFRFNTTQSPTAMQQAVEAEFAPLSDRAHIEWNVSGLPFLTGRGQLTHAVTAAVELAAGVTPELSTSGGTSDGRFIAPTGAEVVELGPVNKTIHKINEHVAVADLEPMATAYLNILANLLTKQQR